MNKNKSLPFVVGSVILVISLIVVFAQNANKVSYKTPTSQVDSTSNSQTPASTIPSTTKPPVTKTPTPTPTPAPTPGQYTLAQIALHDNSSDCWTTINGGVYNVTSWIDQHPGGAEAIISLCGIDGSDAYNEQHGGQRRPANELASFKIGILK